MPRVTLTEQTAYEHRHTMTVRPTDLNYAGHLGNEALLSLVHVARACFLKELGFNTIVGSGQQVGLLIADLAVNFKAEVFAHETLIIDSLVGELGDRSFRLFHRVCREEQLIALVETGLVAFSYHDRQITTLPAEFLMGLQEFRLRIPENTKKTESHG